MKYRSIILAVATVALLATPAVIVAQGRAGGPGSCGNEPQGMGSGHRGGGPGFGLLDGAMGERLGLSDEQKAQVEAIVAAHRSQGEALREQLEAARTAFHAAHPAGTFDEAAARAFAQAQAEIHSELAVQRMKARADIFNVLTPEQQAEMQAIRDLLGDFGGPRHGGRRGGGKR